MFGRYSEAERRDWLQAKARGRSHFIWWRAILPTLLTCFVVVPVVTLFGDDKSSFSVRATVLSSLVVLLIGLVGGYLEGVWKWRDLEKKYPE